MKRKNVEYLQIERVKELIFSFHCIETTTFVKKSFHCKGKILFCRIPTINHSYVLIQSFYLTFIDTSHIIIEAILVQENFVTLFHHFTFRKLYQSDILRIKFWKNRARFFCRLQNELYWDCKLTILDKYFLDRNS
jgi:hypothetical protein